MEPRFRTGDLAVVRRAGRYEVGDVVAYHSTVLHTVVMHRIIARQGSRYVFQGDNNDFIDPSPPRSSDLIGKLWLRVPKVGRLSDKLHTPAITAAFSGTAFAMLLLLGNGRRRRRRDRRGARSTQPREGARSVPNRRPHLPVVQILAASAVVSAALGLLAFTTPATRAVAGKARYSERVSFAYRARTPSNAVYPGGVVKSGQPVFVRLVHRVRVAVVYDLATNAPHRPGGTMEVLATLSSPTGWSRSIVLAAPVPFTGDRASRVVTLDLRRMRSLVDRLETLTGAPAGGGYTLVVAPRVHLGGTLAGRQLSSDFRPRLSFSVDPLQMKLAAGASAPSATDGLMATRKGSVATASRAPNRLAVRGHGLNVSTARWIAYAGLLLVAAGALLTRLPRLRRTADPRALIQARYERLIVPISGIAVDPARPPIDVTTIDALAQLAERSERLILHHCRDDGDTYLVDDEGTLYRYQSRPVAQPDPQPLSDSDEPAGPRVGDSAPAS
jgi:hypothetical protein